MHEYLGPRDYASSAYERKRDRNRESEVIPLCKHMCFILIDTTHYSHIQ